MDSAAIEKERQWKRFLREINRQVFCDDTCSYSSICPVGEKTKVNEGCRLRDQQPHMIQRFFNLFVRGETGMKDEFFETLFHFAAMINFNTDQKGVVSYIDMLQKAHRTYYAKTKKEDDESGFTVNVRSTGGTREVFSEQEDAILSDPETLLDSDVVDTFSHS